jgi:hypothetical protein
MNDDQSSKPTVDDRPRASARRIPDRTESTSERYVAGEEIGRGGMGRVVEATDRHLGRVVAIKEALTTDPEMLRRFARETRITARLEHPSIVPVYDASTAGGAPYYVMRKVSGRPLEELIDAATALDARLALVPHVLAAANAIAHAHGRGIIHRDLKPSNILVGDLGETVVIDWGLAKVVDDPDDVGPSAAVAESDDVHTRFGAVVGTPGFMAPEQLRGDPADRRADVYALGATLYYLLARRAPHHAGSGTEMMEAAAKAPPRPIAKLVEGVPAELATIVDKALAFDAAERYADAAAFAADLGQFLTGKLVASHHYSTRERLVRFVRRNRLAVATVGIAVLALAVGGAFAVRSVLAERDRADDEARLATRRQHEAEAAELRARDRNDQLLLAQARALLANNPTAAVATIKQLARDPVRWNKTWREARAIAAEARRAGVARALPGPVKPYSVSLSPNGTRVALVGDGAIHLYDLLARTRREIGSATDGTLIGFAGDDRVIAAGDRTIRILEATSRVEVGLDHEVYSAAFTATHVVWTDRSKQLWWMSLATRAPAKLATAEGIEVISASPDGKIAIASDDRLAVVELGDAPTIRAVGSGRAISLGWNETGTVLAAGFREHVDRIEVSTRTTTRIPTPGPVLKVVPDSQEVSYLFNGIVYRTRGTNGFPRLGRALDLGSLYPVAGSRLVGIAEDVLVVFDGQDALEIHSPAESTPHVGARASGPYVVTAGRGHLLYWNVDDLIPAPALVASDVAYYVRMGRDDFVVWGVDSRWRWIDRAAGTDVEVHRAPGGLELIASPVHPRVAFFDHAGKTFILEKSGDLVEIDGMLQRFTFLDDGRMLLATEDGRQVLLDPEARVRTPLAAIPGAVHSLGTNGSWVAAHFTDGRLWRANVTSGTQHTTKAQPPLKGAHFVPLDDRGRAFFADGDRLMRWNLDGTVTAHVTIPTTITTLGRSSRNILVQARDGSGYVVDPETPDTLSAGLAGGNTTTLHFGLTGLAVLAVPHRGPRLLDIEVARSWPIFHRGSRWRYMHHHLSHDGRWLTALQSNRLVEWPIDIPETADATRAWLDRLTNATAELGPATLSWH